jgi:hypothetical protein
MNTHVSDKIMKSSGSRILQKNNFFSDLVNLMENKEFKFFYEKYFNDWTDIETMIFYMKLYQSITNEYYERFEKEISKEIITYMMQKIMSDENMRKVAIDCFRKFKDQNYKSFTNLLSFDEESKQKSILPIIDK